MTAQHDLVASAVGYDKARGDVITLRSLPFEPLPTAGVTARTSLWSGRLDPMALVQLAVVSIVALALGLFVLRPILSSSRGRRLPALPQAERTPALAQGAGPEAAASDQALTGEIDDSDFAPNRLAVVSADDPGPRPMTPASEDRDPVARLRHLITERQDETAEILRSWMEDREEPV